MLKEIENLKTQLKGKMPIITGDNVVQKVSACKKYAIDAVYIPLPLRNNRSAHYAYLSYLKDSFDMLREIVEEDRIVKPQDSAVVDACFLTKRSQELLQYAFATCPKDDRKQNKPTASASVYKNNHVTFAIPLNTYGPSNSKLVK